MGVVPGRLTTEFESHSAKKKKKILKKPVLAWDL